MAILSQRHEEDRGGEEENGFTFDLEHDGAEKSVPLLCPKRRGGPGHPAPFTMKMNTSVAPVLIHPPRGV